MAESPEHTIDVPPAGAFALIRWALGAERRWVGVGAVVGTLWMASLAAVPVAVGAAIDNAVDRGGSGDVTRWAVIVAGVIVLGALVGVARHFIAVGLWVRTRWRIERCVTARVLDERGGDVDDAGRLLALATTDAGRIGTVADLMCRGTGAVVTLIGVGVLMVATSPVLGSIVLLGVPVTLAIVLPLWPRAERRFDAQRTRIAEATSTATDTITGLRTIRGLGAEPVARRWFATSSHAVEQSGIDLAKVAGAWAAFSTAIPAVFLAIVLAVAGRLAIDGDLEPGDIVAFTGLATFLAIPFRTIAELFITWAGGIASARRLDELLQAPHRVAAGGGAGGGSNGSLGLHFEAVEAPGLQQFDLSIGADEVVGVASADPDAATTILRLAARHLAPTAGTVRLGHTDLGDLRLDVVRGTVLVDDASQPWLRPGTVGDNLDLAITPHECDDPARHAEHLAALRLAALDELLERDDPLDVLIGSRGLRLSGGQRQRLAVARSVRADSAVLALLDPTSALDSVTESRVAAALVDARRNRCTLLLTTSPAVLARCDRVVFVSDGAVVADGTHAEILHEPEYAALLGATPLEPRA